MFGAHASHRGRRTRHTTHLGNILRPRNCSSAFVSSDMSCGSVTRKSGKSITSAQRYDFTCYIVLIEIYEQGCSHSFLAILQSIHALRVHHGDLRYDNLLVDDSGEVAI